MTGKRMLATLIVAGLALTASPGQAEPPVLQGDPVDPQNGSAYVLLPGVPLVYPGADGVFGTADDRFDTGITGDVDLVVRTQGSVGGGVIQPPSAALSSAPLAVAGAATEDAGTRVPFEVILSDGQVPPAAGAPLAGPELDGRGALVVAYPDIDGDGFIGPTGAPGSSVEIQRQEVWQIAGRRVALFQGGVARETIGFGLGAPASAGGLGIVVAAAATTGAAAPLYFDGPWIATLLPYMLPLDPATIYDADGDPTPNGFIEFGIEPEEIFLPAPGHPILGTPYAIPLDGSSVTVDLARSVSAAAAGAVLARPADPLTFVAGAARRLFPAVDVGGSRRLVEAIDTLAVPDDGPGNGRAVSIVLTDRLGNPADPPAGGMAVTVEVASSLRISAPDTDGAPSREVLTFTSAAMQSLIVDDAGGAGDGVPNGTIVAIVDGRPVGAATVVAGGGGPDPGVLASGRVQLQRARKPMRDRVSVSVTFDTDPLTLDPTTQTVVVTLRNAAGVVYTRTLAPPAFVASGSGRSFKFKDATSNVLIRRTTKNPWLHTVRLKAKLLDLTSADLSAASLVTEVAVAAASFEGTLACTPNAAGTATRCLK